MKLLGVNIDHVATLRQVRGTNYPDPLEAALTVQEAGAHSVTVHLREDRRHIQVSDVTRIKGAIDIPLNLEIGLSGETISIAEYIRPAFCCLVPERREELTTEAGLDVVRYRAQIQQICQRLQNANIEVALFIEPNLDQIDATLQCGVLAIELHTGPYANTTNVAQKFFELNRIRTSSLYAHQHGMKTNAGHGLHYFNVAEICEIKHLTILNIGHSIISEAIFCGLSSAVKKMKNILER